MHFGRLRSVNDLWGFCRDCYYADVCRGGCTWTSHSLLGRPGNNPYCHHRVLELRKQGLRERIVKCREAAQESFAVGGFELLTERIPVEDEAPAELVSRTPYRSGLIQITRPTNVPEARDGRVPPKLEICRECQQYIWPGQTVCPHCGSELEASAKAYQEAADRRARLISELRRLIEIANSGTAQPQA